MESNKARGKFAKRSGCSWLDSDLSLHQFGDGDKFLLSRSQTNPNPTQPRSEAGLIGHGNPPPRCRRGGKNCSSKNYRPAAGKSRAAGTIEKKIRSRSEEHTSELQSHSFI